MESWWDRNKKQIKIYEKSWFEEKSTVFMSANKMMDVQLFHKIKCGWIVIHFNEFVEQTKSQKQLPIRIILEIQNSQTESLSVLRFY